MVLIDGECIAVPRGSIVDVCIQQPQAAARDGDVDADDDVEADDDLRDGDIDDNDDAGILDCGGSW